jgi:hypothetical protein
MIHLIKRLLFPEDDIFFRPLPQSRAKSMPIQLEKEFRMGWAADLSEGGSSGLTGSGPGLHPIEDMTEVPGVVDLGDVEAGLEVGLFFQHRRRKFPQESASLPILIISVTQQNVVPVAGQFFQDFF